MALTILGLSGALSHDPSAALYIDGKLVAAAKKSALYVISMQNTACRTNLQNFALNKRVSSLPTLT